MYKFFIIEIDNILFENSFYRFFFFFKDFRKIFLEIFLYVNQYVGSKEDINISKIFK